MDFYTVPSEPLSSCCNCVYNFSFVVPRYFYCNQLLVVCFEVSHHSAYSLTKEWFCQSSPLVELHGVMLHSNSMKSSFPLPTHKR